MAQVGPRFSIELRSVPFSRALSRSSRVELKMLIILMEIGKWSRGKNVQTTVSKTSEHGKTKNHA